MKYLITIKIMFTKIFNDKRMNNYGVLKIKYSDFVLKRRV